MIFKIMGKNWRVKFTRRMKKAWGACQPPDTPDKKIFLHPDLKGEFALEVLIHECIHAGLWCLDEETVTRLGADLARILWKMGYRKVE